MMRLKTLNILESKEGLKSLPEGKLMINTVNAHSYNVAQNDESFAKALQAGVLIPDGASIVKVCRWIGAKSQPLERIAGWDLFEYEMNRLKDKEQASKIVMFMGSSEKVLSLIRERAAKEYPDFQIATYSPPYKPVFSDEDNRNIVEAINAANPDLLWIGMTAPKQEKWIFEQWENLQIHCHTGAIGAVFDFYAGTTKRAPQWWQSHSLEWLYRLISEPKRMWRRYLIGNTKFLYYMLKEKLG